MGDVLQDRIIIHPRKGRNEREVPPNGLLLVNPGEAANCLKDLRRQGAEVRRLFNSSLVIDPGRGYFAAGPAIGAPMAALTLEKLIVLGAKRIVLCGWCGAISPALQVGDVVVPDRAEAGEGTSAYYREDRPLQPHGGLRRHLEESLVARSFVVHGGCVWSTDALYREDRGQLADLQRASGVVAVDMEFSALCAVAAFRRVAFAAVLVVSDELYGPSWRPGFGSSAFLGKKTEVLTAMLDLAGLMKDFNTPQQKG